MRKEVWEMASLRQSSQRNVNLEIVGFTSTGDSHANSLFQAGSVLGAYRTLWRLLGWDSCPHLPRTSFTITVPGPKGTGRSYVVEP